MIESVKLQNFRCFENVDATNLKRINVIVGANASGKTSFLEACFLASGAPSISFRLRGWRGLGDQLAIPSTQDTLKDLWQDLFFCFDQKKVVNISLKGTPDLTRDLKIDCQLSQEELFTKEKDIVGMQLVSPIKFEWFQGSKSLGIVQPRITEKGMQIEGAPESLKVSFFTSANPLSARELANRYSELSRIRAENDVVATMRKVFPLIEGLSIQSEHGAGVVYADVTGMSVRIPLGLVSTGLNKLFAYVVAIARQRVLLIDEIENGFYYKTLPDVWNVIDKFTTQYKCQVFVSTHSWECLQALKRTMKNKEQNFCLLRVRRAKGKSIIDEISGRDLKSAIDEQMEIR